LCTPAGAAAGCDLLLYRNTGKLVVDLISDNATIEFTS
jgi:hypothetical protein